MKYYGTFNLQIPYTFHIIHEVKLLKVGGSIFIVRVGETDTETCEVTCLDYKLNVKAYVNMCVLPDFQPLPPICPPPKEKSFQCQLLLHPSMTTVLQDYARLESSLSPAKSCVGELLAELVSL